ncbi:hypothetical protein BKA66DRAFT_431542 [Pyrenochaeta sp. MPI-SDFR-AT-0127]|nr:hypothetical protein BKA66DRAFT_431542 [Pyrenochaeta sp. MPI-SDFR-AT-0127]
MTPIRLGPRDLLEYDETHHVLICRECQYAIQKSALKSHLLRHKIYRNERQRLLSSIAQLDLFEPHHVPLPSSECPPFDTLPIISGFRCTVAGCGTLYASPKRIRRHQIEFHELDGSVHSGSLARPVHLQTFFRGTKIRYFEVTFSGTAFGEQTHDVDITTVLPAGLLPLLPQNSSKTSPANFNLETLAYFHHFTTSTSLTLPSVVFTHPDSQYWQPKIVHHALQWRWLMCGVLAISAYHLAAYADDDTVKKVHFDRAIELSSQFSVGCKDAVNDDLPREATQASKQIMYILQCARWVLTKELLDQGMIFDSMPLNQLQCIMTTIRSFIVSEPSSRSSAELGDNGEEQDDMFAHATRILRTNNNENMLSVILDRLNELPSRMAKALGKPDNIRDVLVILSAIAKLVHYCSTSTASTEASEAFRDMATWVIKVPDRFHEMLSCRNPATLVVLAHWAASLVERAEFCGCWYLKGFAKGILLQISKQVIVEDQATQKLIEGLEYT